MPSHPLRIFFRTEAAAPFAGKPPLFFDYML